jgi:uncharacterized protein
MIRTSRRHDIDAPPGRFPCFRAAVLAAAACAAAVPAVGQQSLSLVSIGTGSRTGVYYIAGGAICSLVNEHRWDTGLRCLALKSEGSIENLRNVRSGRQTFGIVQSDWHHHAVNGTGAFAEAGPDRELRSVFALFPEPFTVVARPDAGIATFEDLKGKRVDFGPAGSGGRATMNVVVEELGWDTTDFAYVSELTLGALPEALCGGEIDAAVFIVAHPNLTVEDMVTSCDAVLVPVEGPAIERLIAAHPYYVAAEIPAGTYAGQAATAPAFALGATLVTSSRTSPAVVYDLARAVLGDLQSLRDAHPALAELDPAAMVSEGLTAPLHEGVRRYLSAVR